MTEQEWLVSNDPGAMLRLFTPGFAQAEGVGSHEVKPRFSVSDRKLRLFACACCRQVWHLLTDERNRYAVETVERYADQKASGFELHMARRGAEEAVVEAEEGADKIWWPVWAARACREALFGFDCKSSPCCGLFEFSEAIRLYGPDTDINYRGPVLWAPANLLRCIVGNPCRIVTLPKVTSGKKSSTGKLMTVMSSWYDYPHVTRMAQAVYDDRDFAALPVLADLLEEAGCENTEILMHCRNKVPCEVCFTLSACEKMLGRKPEGNDPDCQLCHGTGWKETQAIHARGCWVVDLLLGKEGYSELGVDSPLLTFPRKIGNGC